MNLVPLNIPPGVVRGSTPYDTPNRWYATNLIRWRGGVMEPIQGWQPLSATNLPLSGDGRIRRMHRWRDNSNIMRTLVFTDSKIRSYTSSGGYVDVTPSDLVPLGSAAELPEGYGIGPYGAEAYGTARSSPSELISVLVPMWSFDNWGEDAVGMASSDGRLLYFDATNPSTALKQIGTYDISSISRTSNVTTVTTTISHGLVTGDFVQIAGVADATYNIASVEVTVTGGTTFTYANTGSDGSSSGGTVRNREVPVSNRAVFVTEERHMVVLQADGNPRRVAWCSREDFTDWDYTSTTNTAGFQDLEARTPLQTAAKVKNGALIFTESEVFNMRFLGSPFVYGFELMEETRLVGPRAVAHDSGVAFWWSKDGFYASDGSVVRPIPCPIWEFLNQCLCPSTITSLVFASDHGELPEIWWFFPQFGSTVADMYVIYNWAENWWSYGYLTRAAMTPGIGNEKPMMADYSGNLYHHDIGYLDGTTSRVGDIYAETSIINVPPAGTQNMEIRQAMFANEFGASSLRATFLTRQTPHQVEREFGPYTARSDGYMDTRVTGRDVRIKIEAINDDDWSLGQIRLDVAAGAKR